MPSFVRAQFPLAQVFNRLFSSPRRPRCPASGQEVPWRWNTSRRWLFIYCFPVSSRGSLMYSTPWHRRPSHPLFIFFVYIQCSDHYPPLPFLFLLSWTAHHFLSACCWYSFPWPVVTLPLHTWAYDFRSLTKPVRYPRFVTLSFFFIENTKTFIGKRANTLFFWVP